MKKQQKSSTKNRDSNIELLRIIAMIMIIAHHFELYALYNIYNSTDVYSYINIIIKAMGKIGVNIFVVISGYFLIKSKFNIKRIIKLWLQIEFYSIGIMLVFKIFQKNNLTINEMLKYAFPISFRKYWFASTYMYLCLLMPFINKFVENINKNTYKNLLILLTILFSLVYSFIYKSNGYQTEVGTFETLTWFIYLYLLAGYIKIYGIKFLEDNKTRKILIILSFITLILMLCIVHFINIKYKRLTNVIDYYTKMNSVFMLSSTICLFYMFKNMKIKKCNIINNISKLTFAVYLIHEHNIIRKPLWNTVKKYMSNYCINEILILITVIILLFLMAYILEKIRKEVLEDNIFKIKKINKICNKIDEYLE